MILQMLAAQQKETKLKKQLKDLQEQREQVCDTGHNMLACFACTYSVEAQRPYRFWYRCPDLPGKVS